MAEELTPAPEVQVPILETPEPKPEPTKEQVLYKGTPDGKEPPAPAVEVKVEAPVTTDPKTPTDPAKKVVEPTPEAVPTEYDLKLPENSPLTKEDLSERLKSAKERGLTKEQAEAELKTENDVAARTVQRYQQYQEKLIKDAQATWYEAVKNDPEIGGDKFKETAILASRAYRELASPAMQKLVKDAGFENHPELVRMMVKAGRLMGEDTVIPGRSGGVALKKSTQESWYGATTPGADGKLPGA